jgi:hypothetical protein
VQRTAPALGVVALKLPLGVQDVRLISGTLHRNSPSGSSRQLFGVQVVVSPFTVPGVHDVEIWPFCGPAWLAQVITISPVVPAVHALGVLNCSTFAALTQVVAVGQVRLFMQAVALGVATH